jgi:hypothetical protein
VADFDDRDKPDVQYDGKTLADTAHAHWLGAVKKRGSVEMLKYVPAGKRRSGKIIMLYTPLESPTALSL